MRQFFKIAICAIIIFGLKGCGGGSSEESSSQPNRNNAALQSSTIFKFTEYPLAPTIANFSADDESHLFPGDRMSLGWDILFETTDSNQKIIYDSYVYLSNDTEIDEGDLVLLDLDCSIPGDSLDSICSQDSDFYCYYGENNQNSLRCGSFPLNAPVRLENHFVDISSFLDIIPKQGYVLFKACLQESPFTCDEASTPIQFN